MCDQSSEGILSPFLRRSRIFAVEKFIRGCVLDIGCGSGGLADYVRAERYYGYDVDVGVLNRARSLHPHHYFSNKLPMPGVRAFDTVAALAVIEHVENPDELLRNVVPLLNYSEDSSIVLTTPNPWFERVYRFGSAVRLFSAVAHGEHKRLLDLDALVRLSGSVGLRVAVYRRFLFGANQLAVFKRHA